MKSDKGRTWQMNKHEFKDALDRGEKVHLDKLLRAVKTGQELHPLFNEGRGYEPLSPLAYAFKWNWEKHGQKCLDLMQALLEAGADPNLPDYKGRRPLHLLVWLGVSCPPEVYTLMIKHGADPTQISMGDPNSSEMSVLELAALYKNLDALDAILDAAPDSPGRCKKSVLLGISWNIRGFNDQQEKARYQAIVTGLIEGGDSPEWKDELGRCALSNAHPEFYALMASFVADMDQGKLDQATPSISKRPRQSRL